MTLQVKITVPNSQHRRATVARQDAGGRTVKLGDVLPGEALDFVIHGGQSLVIAEGEQVEALRGRTPANPAPAAA